MLHKTFRCVALAEWEGGSDKHVATLLELGVTADLKDGEFGVVNDEVKVEIPPNALVVGKAYRLRIEEAES